MLPLIYVLIVVEADLPVLKVAYASLEEARQAWRDFVADAAKPNTVLYEELLHLSLKVERDPSTTAAELIEYGISDTDLIEWWTARDPGNQARFYEVQDKR